MVKGWFRTQQRQDIPVAVGLVVGHYQTGDKAGETLKCINIAKRIRGNHEAIETQKQFHF